MRFTIASSATFILLTAAVVSIWPEGEANAQTEDYKHSWIDVDGVKAHYIEAGEGDPFVLVHGSLVWSSGEANYGEVVGPLGKHFHAIAVDIVGFGQTTPLGPQHYSGEAQANFLIRFIDALDVGPVFLTGNSHGGFLTQYVAHDRPDLVRKLVITSSGSGTRPIPPLPEGRRYIYAPGGRQFESQTVEQIRSMLEDYYQHEDLVTEERVQLVYDNYARNYEFADKRGKAVGYSVEVYNENKTYKGKHISDWGGELEVPVLLMWSQPGSGVEWGLKHFFKVPGAEMRILPWSGHHLFTDQSDRWVQVVTNWLQNEPARPPNP